MRTQARLILSLLMLAGCQTTPPTAKRIPHVTAIHGDRRVDDYFWLREKDSPAVRAYLKAENAYADRVMKPTLPLQEKLYREMLGHIQETDRGVAYRDGDWLYYYRTESGKQYRIHCRKRGSLAAPEQVVLDLNELAAGKEFIDLGVFVVSDDGYRLAYSLDATGFQEFTLFVKDLRTGQLLTEKIPNVAGCVWAADNKTLFYVTEDDAKRSYRLWRHELGASADTLLYEEKDALYSLGIGRSRSKKYVFAVSASRTTTEFRYLRADQPAGAWQVVAPRVPGHEYDMDHAGDLFFIRTNDRGQNFRLVTAPVTDPQTWTELVPHRADVVVADLTLFAQHYVVWERVNGLARLRVVELATGKSRQIDFPDATYSLGGEENAVFQTNIFRYGFESLRTPYSIFDCDLATGQSTLLKQQPVKNYDATKYQVERLFAPASDGTQIPISLVRRTDVARRGLLLDGYGAYGLPEDVWFSGPRLVLLDRGVTFAIAHVRGGGEFGKPWHDAGRMLQKPNTFSDFIACAEFLVRHGYDRPVITGGSAGGLLVGAVLNQRPDLFRAALVEVPFVDVINTMLDETLPLTVGEFEEWGNPKEKEFYDAMRQYSPYDNLAATNYPPLLVKTSLNDSRVMYWEPAKYVAKLRALKTDRNPLLFKIELAAAGHSGKSGRYDVLRDIAFDYAFLLWQWGIRE
ncbi:MAG: Dipeptidyl aminopeptidase BI [Verrucomicrobiae bacterium]|nr:Dipeptidyl aminopeptidase BI [Verrucomicrobiae bacterium]